ncbi:MAG: glycine cleavage system protein GcvH [Planctomycetes bacterium]|nr:glycine cleavage system protein GcvH [Planctomycetota bacterium]
MDPASLKYAKTHEWVRVEGDVATVGITDFAVRQLTDLVYIELPSPGRTLAAGEEFGVIESVKAASDLYAPVGGEVLQANESLADDLSVLSADAFGQGWMIRMKIADRSSLDKLLDRAAYEEHCRSEEH